jgi:DNA-binding MarR family transcriptional regulator
LSKRIAEGVTFDHPTLARPARRRLYAHIQRTVELRPAFRPRPVSARANPVRRSAVAAPARGHRDAMFPGGLDHGPMRKLLGYNLAQAGIPSLKIFVKRIGDPFQLRRLDFTLLMLVAANPGVTQRQLSLALDVSAPRLTLVFDKLEERELITRTRSEDDRRKQSIALTRKGAALVKKADRIAEGMEKELLGHLTDVERSALFQLLEKVASHRRV